MLHRRVATLLASTFLLTTLTHSTLAQNPEALERKRAVDDSIAAQLVSQQRREMYIATDKPLYHPGETVWFRAFEVDAKTLSGTSGEHGVTFQLIDGRGAKVAEKRVLSRQGSAANDFIIGLGMPGGNYTLKATSELGTTEERAFVVSSYEVPRLKKVIDFTRASYAPGDLVTALISVEKATGEPAAGARATAAVGSDGVTFGTFVVPLDGRGNGVVRFQVPPVLKQSNLTLTLNVDAGGIAETLQRRVPVVLGNVDLKLLPEGGDLVAGLASRVYVMGRDELGKPVEVEGNIVDDRGAVVASFKSMHDGMARFALTPQPGRTYQAKLLRPSFASHPLPAVKASGCVLRADDAAASLKLSVACSAASKVVAAATLRDRLLASAPADVEPKNIASIELPVPDATVGAVRVALFDADRNPLAERLVFHGLGHQLKVQVSADKKEYAPREKVTLTVRTTADGKPVPADVALSVVDDSVLRFADSKAADILADLYLAAEMPGQKIFEPNFYFSSDPKAPEALDLLLGTQGYRRFAWKLVPR